MENNMETVAEEKNGEAVSEISFASLWNVFRKNWIWILSFTLVVTLCVGAVTKVSVKDKYQARLIIWIANEQSSAESISTTVTSGAAAIAQNCSEVVTLTSMLRGIVKASVTSDEIVNLQELFGLSEYDTVRYLQNHITTKHESNSVYFEVIVTDINPEVTWAITDALQHTLPEKLSGLFELSLKEEKKNYVKLIGDEMMQREEVKKLSPGWIRYTALAGGLSLLAIYAFFFLLSLLDTLVYDETQLKKSFAGLPVLGTIPQWFSSGEKRKGRTFFERLFGMPGTYGISRESRLYEGKLIDSQTPFAVTEAFNLLRTNLSYSSANEKTQVYALTSAYAGAGKSLISTNLALSFAGMGKKVLLVECDMRMPSFFKIFKLQKQRTGLSELLAGLVKDQKEAVVENLYENLSVISSGRTPPNPSELLGQKRMRKLVDGWKNEYDIILLDMPPIAEVTDAGVVADIVDGYLLCVRSEYSDIGSVNETIGLLKKVNANIVGFVLNDVNPKISGNYYYSKKGYYKHYGKYGYGRYGYGHYGHEDASAGGSGKRA